MLPWDEIRLWADYHTHTRHSHGRGTVADNARAALAAGLREVAVTDHGPALSSGSGLKDPGVLEHIRQEVEEANLDGHGLRVLQGVEANVMDLDGRLDLPDTVLRRLDIVLVGLHPATAGQLWGELRAVYREHVLARVSAGARRRVAIENTKALAACVARHPVDVVVHPGLKAPVDALELGRAAVRAGVALEINSAHQRLDVEAARDASHAGCSFVIGSDAHSPARVGDLGAGLRIARQAGIPPEAVLNAAGGGRRSRGGP